MTATMERAGSTTTPARYATPRDLSRPTLGGQVGDIAARMGRPLMAWQQNVVDVAMELDPDGSFHYDEVVLTVPRQSGKTALILAFMVHRLTKMSRRLGRQRCTYTAQLRAKARLKLERDFAEVLRDGAPSFREITAVRVKPSKPHEWHLSLNNGAENIQFGKGNYLQIDAPSRTGGHGDTLDLGILDEAFAHYDDTIEAGMSPSMITRAMKQIVVLSTAGDAKSVYLWRKIVAGRRACETGNHGRTAYFEYSAEEGADPGAVETWLSCSPALCLCPGQPVFSGACPTCGCTITLRALEGEWEKAQRGGQEGIDQFRRAFLNQWPETPTLIAEEQKGWNFVPEQAWLSQADPTAERGKRAVFGVDIGEDRLAHVGVAWKRPDGGVQVMLADTNLSPLATPDRLKKLTEKWKAPVVLGGPSAALEEEIKRSLVASGTDFAEASGRFDDLLRAGDLWHGNQPELNDAVKAALWRHYGTAGGQALQLRDAPLVGPLAAVIRAIHGLTAAPKPPATPRAARSTPSRRAETADLSSLSF